MQMAIAQHQPSNEESWPDPTEVQQMRIHRLEATKRLLNRELDEVNRELKKLRGVTSTT